MSKQTMSEQTIGEIQKGLNQALPKEVIAEAVEVSVEEVEEVSKNYTPLERSFGKEDGGESS